MPRKSLTSAYLCRCSAGMCIAAALITVAACSGPRHASDRAENAVTPPPVRSSPSAPSTTSTAAISLPLDNYLQLSSQSESIIERALAVATEKCMAAKGFSYDIQNAGEPAQGSSTSEGSAVLASIYGISNMSLAKTDGYGSNTPGTVRLTSPTQLPEDLTLQGQVAEHGAAYVRALYGYVTPPSPGAPVPKGCDDAGDGIYSAYGSADRNLVGELGQESISDTESDSRVVAAEAKWSSCMSRQGFSYANPREPAAQSWPTPPSRVEIATAIADVTCKDSTDLTGIVYAVLDGYQRELVARNISALTQLNVDLSHVVQRAQRLIAVGTGT